MHNFRQNGSILGILAISLVALGGCGASSGIHPYQKTNQIRVQDSGYINHKNPNARIHPYARAPFHQGQANKRYAQNGRYGPLRGKKSQPAYVPAPGSRDMFQRWVDYEPQYTMYPGDQIDVVVQSAPELSRTLTVAPDGRISMPMASSIMVAGRPVTYVRQALKAELSKQLVDPTVAITHRAFAAQNIYVGGQVAQQGTFALSGPIGSLEAIIMAGGFLPSAKTREVAILRRAPNGGLMMRVIDHKRGLQNVRSYADNMQLRRGDIVFVPRSSISEVGIFVQQIRAAIPVDIGLSYNIGDNFSNNTTP